MKDILLVVMMLALFAFGYFVINRFGTFMDKSVRGHQEPQIPDRKVYVSETKGKNKETILKEVDAVLDSLADEDDYEIIVCKTVDPRIIEYLEESGCKIKYDHRIN